MKYKNQKNNFNDNMQSTTSTKLQADVDSSTTSLYSPKLNGIELLQYKVEQHEKQLSEIHDVLKEINMPLIDKFNKYKEIFIWAIGAICIAIFTVSTWLYKLYNDNLQAHFDNIYKINDNIDKKIEDLRLDVKEITKKENDLEIKFIENLKNHMKN